MKFHKIIYILLSSIIFMSIGCVSARKPEQPKTVLEKRAVQTREYETGDFKMVMKAIINVLQDEGFMVSNTELDLGLITAKKHLNIKSNVFSIVFLRDNNETYNKTNVIECNIQVSQRGKELTRVRVTFQQTILNNNGSISNVNHINNPSFYQTFFGKIDKGIFIEKEGV